MTREMTGERQSGGCLRKPEWLKVRLPGGPAYSRVRGVLADQGLHSVCQEARCPNITECFQYGTATFLIMGNVCTRACLYCRVAHGPPAPPDRTEPERIAEAARQLQLNYIVITSVTRDDLPDGGAGQFVSCIEQIRHHLPQSRIEVLIPDLLGKSDALHQIIQAKPDVLSHNMEITPSLFRALRPQGDYRRSLELLYRVHQAGNIITKSGFMVGVGEDMADIDQLLSDLSRIRCQRITIGQYQQPTAAHWPVKKYYHPAEFALMKARALFRGFGQVTSGPLVRSSYHADTGWAARRDDCSPAVLNNLSI